MQTTINDDQDDLHEKITNQLLTFEQTVLKRVVKLKQADTYELLADRSKLTLLDGNNM